MTIQRFEDDATSVVDDSILAEIRAEAARRARAGQTSEPAGSADEFATAGLSEKAEKAEPAAAHGLADDDLPTVEGYGALREIGRGGFSRVYEALQFDFDRWVALKVLNETLDGDETAEFERECRLMGVLSRHPNIVTVFNSVFTEGGLPCISMELFGNGSYLDVIQDSGPLGLEELFAVAVSISGALGTAHRQGVVHGDVKPQNIFRSEFGAALGDFGIASLINHGLGPAKTRLSLYYAAPEVIERGAAALSPFSDQYSLAATLYTLATGERPFQASDTGSTRELLLEALTAPLPRLGKEFPAAFADTLHTAMTREPALRYRDMRAFAAAVSEVEAELGYRPTEMRILTGSGRYAAQVPGHSASRDLSESRDASPTGSSGAPRSGPTTGPRSRTESRELSVDYDDATIVRPVAPRVAIPTQDPPAPPPPKKRRKWMLTAAAVLVLAAAGGAAAFLSGRGFQQDQTEQANTDSTLETVDAISEAADLEDAAIAEAEAAAAAAEATAATAQEALAAALADDGVDPAVVTELQQRLAEAEEALAATATTTTEPPPPLPEPDVPDVAAPRGLTASAAIGTILVSWNAPDPQPQELLHYRVEWAPAGRSFNTEDVVTEGRFAVVAPSELDYEITSLDPDTTYTVRVAARVPDGLGEWTQAQTATPGAPSRPSSVEYAVQYGAISVRWAPPEDPSGLTGYLVEWEASDGSGSEGDELLLDSVADEPAYEITGLTNGTEYQIRVFAVGEGGTSDPAILRATPVNDLPVRVAYSTTSAGATSIGSVLPDGLDSTKRTADVSPELTARDWSPDRAWIAIDSRIGGNWEIATVNTVTGEEIQLTCNSVNDWGAAWSPDGSRIAFVKRAYANNHDVYVLDLATGVETQITRSSDDDQSPTWSPDGSQIAFTRGRSGTREAWVVTVATQSERRLTFSDRDVNAPAWAPDSSQIAFADGYGSDRDILVIDADGGSTRAVTTGGFHDDEPTWSPDGSQIAFARGTRPNRDIYVADASSGDVTPLVLDFTSDDYSPAWAPSTDIAVNPQGCN